MITLSEIDSESNFIKAGILEHHWWGERRLPVVCNRREVMLYIERLEDDRRHLLASVMQLLTIARGEQSYHNSIILKAQHLLATIDQLHREREEATHDNAE